MKKTKFLLTLLMAIVMMAMSPAKVWADDLTPLTAEQCTTLGLDAATYTGYYAIGTASDLTWFRDFVNTAVEVEGNTTYPNTGANAVLTADIDMSPVCHAANTTTGATMLSWEPIGAMSSYLGTFDGNNKTITGLYANNGGQFNNALFATIGAGSKVMNLTVDGNVTGTNAAIIVYGSLGNSEITNCISKGSVNATSANTAGVLGSGNGNATVTYCTNYATITLSQQANAGGVVGWNPLKVEHCVNYGDVIGLNNTGGVVGQMSTATNPVSDCANYGNVTSNGSNNYVGGIVGYGYSAIRCSNYGNVTAESTNNVGGIFGWSDGGGQYPFKECLNTGDIKGKQNVGGLVGYTWNNNNANSYSTGKVEAASSDGGLLIGYYNNNPSSALSNVYYVKGATVKVNGVETANQIQGGGYTINASQNVGKSTAEFASGEVCYLLNGSRSAGTAESPLLWYQRIGADASPTFDQNQYAIVKYDATDGYYNDPENFASIEIQDGAAYKAKLKRTTDQLTYTRTFGGTNWTTWYVPFDLTLTDDICAKYAFSRINNVHQYDENEDGVADKTVIESFRQKSGVTLKANYPYLVKALTDGDKTMELTLTDVTLAKADENSIDCQSVDYSYTFTGTYAALGESGNTKYSLFDDTETWMHFHSLKPQRHYMTITSRSGSTSNPAPGRVVLDVIGDEDAMGLVTVYADREAGDCREGKMLIDGRIVVVTNGKWYNTEGQQIR